MKDKKYCDAYQLHGYVEGACLYRDGKVVTTKEHVFEVILEAHRKLSYAKCEQQNKSVINTYLNYHGDPGDSVKCFIDCCSIVSFIFYICFFLPLYRM